MINEIPLIYSCNYNWKIITQPTTEPITVSDVKEFARIEGEDENSLIESMIVSIRQSTENYLRKALITRTIRLSLDQWNSEVIELPCPPLISIISVQTVDESDVTTDYSSSNYYVITDSIPGKLVIKNGVEFPTNTQRYYSGYRINYYAGYGTASDVPSAIREAMKFWVTELFEARATQTEPPPEAKKMLDLYRLVII